MADERTEKGQLETKFPLSPIRNLLLQEISGAGIYFCKLEPRIPIQHLVLQFIILLKLYKAILFPGK